MITNLGPAIPLSSALPQRRSAVEFYGDHRRNKSAREDHRGDAPPIDVGEQYASILANAAPKGNAERRQITPLEATTTRSRLDLTGDAMPTQASIAALLERLDALNAIHARLDKLDAAIAQLLERVNILDGNTTGEAA
jgi:hypothetical protein